MAEVPGGESGMLVRGYKEKKADRLVTRIEMRPMLSNSCLHRAQSCQRVFLPAASSRRVSSSGGSARPTSFRSSCLRDRRPQDRSMNSARLRHMLLESVKASIGFRRAWRIVGNQLVKQHGSEQIPREFSDRTVR